MDRFQNYFIYDNQVYYTGQVVLLKCFGEEMEAAFVCYNKLSKRFTFHLNHWKHNHDIGLPQEDVRKQLIKVYTGMRNPYVRYPTTRHQYDSEIKGLPLAWSWYIFLMVISVVFKDRIGLWIFYSIVFFSYRSKKKKSTVHADWYYGGSSNREYNESIHGADYYKPYYDWKAAQEAELRKSIEEYMKRGF